MFKWLAALLVAVVGAVALIWFLGRSSDNPEKKKKAGGPPKVPVTVERVERRDVPQVARGIGSVQSLHSVVLRAQVEGVLSSVHFKEGQQVERGQLLATIDDRAIAAELAAARAEKGKSEAQLLAVKADLVRYENLVKDEAIARQTVDQQKSNLAQLQASLRGNDAAIKAAEVRLSFTRIVSPISGRVGRRSVDAGNVVRPGDAAGIVTVTQMDPIAVRFALPQDFLGRLSPFIADPSKAPVVALDRDAGARLAEGRLAVIDNQVDPTTGTLSLKAEFGNTDGRLWPGQFVAVELTTGVAAAATVVSSRAVQRGRDGTFVFRVEDGGKASVVPVKVAWQDDAIAVIASGVAPGDTVVTDGQSRLKQGSLVAIGGKPGTGTQTTQATQVAPALDGGGAR